MTRLRLWLLALLLIVLFSIGPKEAAGHLIRYPDKPLLSQLENRERSQERNLAHAQYVCRRGGGKHRRWACKAVGWIGRELAETRALLVYGLAPIPAIHAVFGPYGWQAVEVSRCETGGTFSVWAENGQYRGLFQMGSYARSTYGHSSTAYGQARAAHRYFVASGSDWSPWECKP